MENNLKPYLSMWFYPKRTIKQLIDSDSWKWAYIFIAIAGGSSGLDWVFDQDPVNWSLLPLAVIGGIVLYLVLILYILAPVIEIVGFWFGGKTERHKIQITLGWSHIIYIVFIATWILNHDKSYPIVSYLNGAAYIWSCVILFAMLSETLKLTILKTVMTYITSWILIAIPGGIIYSALKAVRIL